jgi:MFS family permease
VKRSLGAVAYVIAAAFLGSTIVTPLYALYRREFGFSEITLTLIYAVYVVGNLGALLVFGRLSDQVGRRRVALPALSVACLSALLFLFAAGTAWLFAARLLSGLAVGVISGTSTAWLTELFGSERRNVATLLATSANLIGAAAGPVLGGLLAEYAPLPLQLPFVLYILLLAGAGIGAFRAPETVRENAHRSVAIPRPRIGIPGEIRAKFVAPAATVFVTFALGGFFAALIPTIMSQSLHQSNVAAAGAIVCELFGVPLPVMFLSRDWKSTTMMLSGLVTLFPSLALLVAAQAQGSMQLLLAASALGGVALGLGYRGSLQVVNEIAPDDRRGEVTSAYYIACFAGNAVPVIGVGVVASLSNALTASITFACTIAALAGAGLFAGVRYRP